MLSSTDQWKNQDKEYHEDSHVVESFDRRIVRKYRHEHKFYTIDRWVSELKANNAKVVMDYGCATGTASLALLRNGMKAVSVDASAKMLKQVENKASLEGLKAETVMCDVEQMPFENKSFDGIMCLGVLHHLPNIPKAIEEQIRVLKTGGMLFISEPLRDKPWISYPYYSLLEVIKFLVRIIKREKVSTPERTLTDSDIKDIKTIFDHYGIEYEITYFIYWSNLFGYMPEVIAYPMIRLVNYINKNSSRGDAIFIKARIRL